MTKLMSSQKEKQVRKSFKVWLNANNNWKIEQSIANKLEKKLRNYLCEGKPAYYEKKGWYRARGFNVDNPPKKLASGGGDPKINSVLESIDYNNLLMFLILLLIPFT